MKFSILGSGNFNTDVILDLPAITIPKSRIDIDPTDRAMIEESLENYTEISTMLQNREADTDFMFSVTDDEDNATWLTVRRSDGMAPDFVVDNFASRLPLSNPIAKMPTDPSKWAIYGGSDARGISVPLGTLATSLGVTDYLDAYNNGATADSLWDNQGSRPAIVEFTNNRIEPVSTKQTVNWVNGFYRASFRPRVSYVGDTGIQGTFDGNGFARTGVVTGSSKQVNLDGPVQLISKNGIEYADAVQFWMIGRNDLAYYPGMATVRNILDQYAVAFAQVPTHDKKVLILGCWPQTTPSGVTETVNALNTSLDTTYGERFVNINPYLMGTQVWTDTGIIRTTADINNAAAGLLPPSLAADTVHLLPSVYQAVVTNLIRPRLLALGWYN